MTYVGPLISTEVNALGKDTGKAVAIIKLEVIVPEGAQLDKDSALAILDYARDKIASRAVELKLDWT